MLKKLMEIKVKIYYGDEYERYMDAVMQRRAAESEGDSWKMDMEMPPFPTPHIARMAIDPENIQSYTEVFSLEESAKNKKVPKLDEIVIDLKYDLTIKACHTYDEFKQMLADFYSQS